MIKNFQGGAAAPNLGAKALAQFEVPIPPLAEQEEIVEVLDKAFAAIDQAKANIEQNIANAKELFQSKLNQIFSQKGEGWVETTLGDGSEFRNGVNFSKNSKGESVKVVGVGDFKNRFWTPLDALKHKVINGKLNPRDSLEEGDILFVRSNGNKKLIGRCMLVGPIKQQVTHSGFTIRMRNSGDTHFPPYICWYLKSETIRATLTGGGSGAQISNLNQGALSSLGIRIPPLSVQKRTVEEIDSLSGIIQEIIGHYERRFASLEELKKSILQKAFAGELT